MAGSALHEEPVSVPSSKKKVLMCIRLRRALLTDRSSGESTPPDGHGVLGCLVLPSEGHRAFFTIGLLGAIIALARAYSVLQNGFWDGGQLDPRSATGFSDDTHQSPTNAVENV